MSKKFFFAYCVFFIVLVRFNAKAQNFTIDAVLEDTTSLEIILEPIYSDFKGSEYFDGFIKKREGFPVNVVETNGKKFHTEGNLSFPIPFELGISKNTDGLISGSNSDFFFLESGSNTILVTKLSISNDPAHPIVTLKKDNMANAELRTINELLGENEIRNTMNRKTKNIEQKQVTQEILGNYIQEHPDSFVALWLSILEFQRQALHPVMLDNLSQFSTEIKESKAYKSYSKELQIATEYDKSNWAGSQLPFDKLELGSQLKNEINKQKLTLIDFWGSWCGPCIKSFPRIKELENKYSSKGLEILLISIDDRKEGELKAIEILNSRNYNWLNFFNRSGSDFNFLSNSGIPFHLLVNQNGTILHTGFDLDEAEKVIAAY